MSRAALKRGGILLVDKAVGPSSHDVVQQVRRIFSTRAVGHCGTLDPLASGLLVVMLEQSTRLAAYATDADKVYRCHCQLGVRSNTEDREGQVLERKPSTQIDTLAIERALAGLRGAIEQIPPAFSAIKVDGQRAYNLARQGQEFSLKARPITVHRLELIAQHGDMLELDIKISKGGYIRSLVRDLGQALGCGAMMTKLRRSQSGHFDVSQALSLEQIAEKKHSVLLQPLQAFVPETRLALDQASAWALWQTGRAAYSGPWPEAPQPWLAHLDGDVVGIVLRDPEHGLRLKRGFPAPQNDPTSVK